MIELTYVLHKEDKDRNIIEERKIFLCENVLFTGRYLFVSKNGTASRLDYTDFDYFVIKEAGEQK